MNLLLPYYNVEFKKKKKKKSVKKRTTYSKQEAAIDILVIG
jgi:hypothetical protein